jgi:hypothetical protein
MKSWKIAVAAGALALSASALAAEPGARSFKSKVVRSESPAAQAQTQVAGVRLQVDPATGRLVKPTAEQRAALKASLAQQLGRSPEGLRTVERPDGKGALVVVEQGYQNAIVVHRNADGTRSSECTASDERATQLLLGEAAAPTSNELQ